MGFCNRCGEITSSGKCRKCGGREVAPIIESIHPDSVTASLLRWPIRSSSGSDGRTPTPSRTTSTPVISSAPGTANSRATPNLLTKGSTRNSSFFLNRPSARAAVAAIGDSLSGSQQASKSKIKPPHQRPRLGPQFFRQPSESMLNSPSVSTPAWPTQVVAASPVDMSVKAKCLCQKCNEPMKGSRKIRVPPSTPDETYMLFHYDCLKCPACNQHFTKEDYFIRQDHDVYHSKCRPECSACHKHIIEDTCLEQDSKKYHLQCAFKCTRCNKVEPGAKKLYCRTCAPPARRRCVSSSAVLMQDSKPSDIFKCRTRALPPLGGSKFCPRCGKSVGIMDETLGPRASSWHKKCLACAKCSKRMDSDAKIFQGEQGECLVYCRSCLNNNSRASFVR